MSAGFDRDKFVASFPVLAEAEGGTKRLRQFVLSLAVRGLLVEQRSHDAPVASLLSDIDRARRAERELPIASDEVEPYSLPTSWRWSRLGLIGRVVGGGTPKTGEPDYWADGPERGCTPWLTPADLYGFKAKRVAFGRRFITKRGLEESSARVLPPGAVLFSSRAPIGYVAIAEVELATNQGFKSIVPWIGDMSEYIYLFLQSAARAIDAAASGTTFKEVSGKDVSLVWIPVPPLAEQKRIVAKVDELMRLIDDLEAKQAKKREVQTRFRTSALDALTRAEGEEELGAAWKRVAGNFEVLAADLGSIGSLRDSVVSLALKGVLVPHEAGADALREIAARKPGSPGVPIDEQPYSLPAHWCWQRLEQLMAVITDGDHQPPPQVPTGINFLTIGNVSAGVIKFDGSRCVSKEYFDNLDPRRVPRKGDILYTVVGATYGRPVPVESDRPFCVQRHIAILKPDGTCDRDYALLFLRSPLAYSQATAAITGTAQPTVPLRPLRRFLVPLPPLAEQKRIVAKVDSLMKLCDDLEARLRAKETTAAKLVDAVVRDLSA